jgi:hypothetical protein
MKSGSRSGQLNSPFNNPHGVAVPHHTTEPGAVIDHNVCEYFAEPRAAGHGGVDEVFFVGVVGKNFHGSIEGAAATISTTMQSGKKK